MLELHHKQVMFSKSWKLKLCFQNFYLTEQLKHLATKISVNMMKKKLWELFLCVCVHAHVCLYIWMESSSGRLKHNLRLPPDCAPNTNTKSHQDNGKSITTMHHIHWDTQCKIRSDYSHVLLIQHKYQGYERSTCPWPRLSALVTQ